MADGWEPVLVGGQAVCPGGDGPPQPTRKDPATPWPWEGSWPRPWYSYEPRPRTRRTHTHQQKTATELGTETCRCGHGRAHHGKSGKTACDVGHPSRFARQFAATNPHGCTCLHFRHPPRAPDAPHRRGDHWTMEEFRAVLDARARGVTYKALGARFGGLSATQMRCVFFRAERARAAGRLPPPEYIRRRRQLRAVPRLSTRADIC